MRSEFAALERACGLPLTSFRPEHVGEQVERARRRERVETDEALADRLGCDGEARRRFRRSVAISHGALFRDPEQFELLETTLLPRLLERGTRLSVWSAGCSDGAELHSLGLLLERLGALERTLLLGSDLLEENLALARAGDYAATLRGRMRWEQRDLSADGPPPGPWRLVLCRNVAIYLEPGARGRLYRTLVAALSAHGILLLGRSERLLDPASLGLLEVAPHAYQRAG